MVRSRTYIATPPGATIKEQLHDRGMSQKEFAIRMNLSEKHISRLINGEVQLTPDVAIRLETVLGVPASFWNNLEAIYREKLIKAEAENSMDLDLELAKQFPYAELAKLGWVPESKSPKERVLHLRNYFEVVELSLLGNERITNIACRRLAVTEKSDLALMAWAQEARLQARKIATSPINLTKLQDSIPDIKKMTLLNLDKSSDILKNTLSECGIAIVYLPHLKGSFLHGATFLSGKKYVMGITARGKDADKFWFSLFHELGHIILGHVGSETELTEKEENEANTWAADALISPESFQWLVETGEYTKQMVCDFAKTQNIAPGIVVGRLQREGIIRYNRLNDLKEKYEIG